MKKALLFIKEHGGNLLGIVIILVLLFTFVDLGLKQKKDNPNVGDVIIMSRFRDLERSIRDDSLAWEAHFKNRQLMIDSLPKQTVIQKIIYKLQNENNLTYSASDSVLYRQWANGLIKEAGREKSGYYDSILNARSNSAASKNAESLRLVR